MLRNRIFLVILIGLVPIGVAAALGVYAVNNSHNNDVARLESAVLTQKAQEVESFVNGSVLSQTRILIPYSQGIGVATSAQKFVIGETLDVLPFLQSESFIDLTGKETMRIDRAHRDGYPASALRDMSTAPEYLAARAGNSYVGPVSYDARGPMITFSSPVKNEMGDLLAIVSGEAYLNQVQAIVAQAKIGDTGYLYLVDGKGILMGGGGPLVVADQTGSSSFANLAIVQGVLDGKDFLTADTQARYRSVFGEPVVAAAKYLPAYGWGLVAEWPTREANALIDQLFLRNAFTLGIVLVLAFALSLALAAHVVRPIRKLKEGAERVAHGDFKEGVAIATGDELQELGESFNSMVQGLKQLEQLKDEFVFIAAHELRTPVAAMKGYLSLILDGATGAVTPETKAYVEKVIASDNRLVQLVNDLLEVARSQAGRLVIQVAPIDVVPAVRGVIDELHSLADEKGVVLQYAPAENMPKAMGDTDRIKEVLINLVGNAIKYMGGKGTVTITHEVIGRDLVTHVADTGLGMSKAAQEKLFEKFYRIQTEKTREITGTGLGLFIVRQIIEKMGGKIWVESEEGKGSAFSFSLPLAA